MLSCPECHKAAELIDSKEVYGTSYGWMYICRPCDTRVGCHKGTKKPLGPMAGAELRGWRQLAHAEFDPFWQGRDMNRFQAYVWLARQVGVSVRNCHIGMFDAEMCDKVISICRKARAPQANKDFEEFKES